MVRIIDPSRLHIYLCQILCSGVAAEKDAAFRKQQELLKARRDGSAMNKANARRKGVQEYVKKERDARKEV